MKQKDKLVVNLLINYNFNSGLYNCLCVYIYVSLVSLVKAFYVCMYDKATTVLGKVVFHTKIVCVACIFFSAVFIQFQSCYYFLYQCLVPNTREALSLLVQHYNVPEKFKRSVLSGENPRLCNQGILNYLLIVLRADKKGFGKFWKVLKTMVKQPSLRSAVEEIQKSTYL